MHHPISRAWYKPRSPITNDNLNVLIPPIAKRDASPSSQWDTKNPGTIVLIVFLCLLGLVLLYLLLAFSMTGTWNPFQRKSKTDLESGSFPQRHLSGLRTYKKPTLSTVHEHPSIEMSDVPLTPPPTLHRKPTNPKYDLDYFKNWSRNNPERAAADREARRARKGKGKMEKVKNLSNEEVVPSPLNPFYKQHQERASRGQTKVPNNPYNWEHPGAKRVRLG